MRNLTISAGEHYHIYNRGNNKQPTFLDAKDWQRFLFLILYLQSPLTTSRIDRRLENQSVQHSVLDTEVKEIVKNRYVELVNYILMPNHFHLTVQETQKNGIARYMQRTLNAYTKYFNTKYEKNGHLFQGPFQAKHITSNDQLLYLSTYIHRNCRELKDWAGKEHFYPWSSYQDYLGKNRWGKLVKTEIITQQFPNPNNYKRFVESSTAKDKLFHKELLLD